MAVMEHTLSTLGYYPTHLLKPCEHLANVKDASHREEQDPELSVLQLLPGDEPGGEGGHQHADEGGLVGGDVVGDPGVVHRQVRQGLVNILRTGFISTNKSC